MVTIATNIKPVEKKQIPIGGVLFTLYQVLLSIIYLVFKREGAKPRSFQIFGKAVLIFDTESCT